MLRSRLVAVLLALAAAAPAGAASRYRPKGRPVPYDGHFSTFPSGLRLVVYEMPHVDRFMLSVSYRGGSASDPPGKEGLAHLAEHLAFRARPKPGLPRYWEQLHATGWAFNAYTGADDTVYFEIGKPEDLRWALALEAARMSDPLLGVTEDDLAVERDVVVSEYRERFETLGSAAEIWPVLRAAFPDGHPYARATAHDPRSYRQIALADVQAWVKERYQPAGVVMVVVSPMKAKETADLVLATFGKLAAGDGARREPLPFEPPPPPGEVKQRELVRVEAPVHMPRLWVAWPAPGLAAGLEPLARATAAGLGAALRRALKDDVFEDVVNGVSTGFVELDGAGLLLARVELRDAKEAARIAERVRSAAAERLLDRQPGVISDQIGDKLTRLAATDAVREGLLVQAYLDLEQLDTSAIARNVRATGLPDYLRIWGQRIATQLGADRVDGYAYANLKRERSVAVLVVPDGNDPPSSAAPAPVRRQGDGIDELEDEGGLAPPGPERALVAARAPGLDKVERRVLPNGLEVIVARRGTLPIVDVRLVVRTDVDGTEAAPAGLPLLLAASHSGWRSEWEQALVGALRWIRFGRGSVTVHSRGSAANVDVLLEGVETWARWSWVERLDDARIGLRRRVRNDLLSPVRRARNALDARLFAGHPYGASPSRESVDAISEKAFSRWTDRSIRPERSTLIIAGDVDPGPELWAAIEGRLGSWRAGSEKAEPLAPPARPAKRSVVLLHRPRATQALLLVGWQAPPRTGRDEAAVEAIRSILSDRLTRRVRVEEGASYGVRLFLDDRPAGSALVAATAVDPPAAGEALRQLLDGAAGLAQSPPDATTTARARWRLARSFGLAFDTVEEAADALELASLFALGPDHFEKAPAAIAALDPARVQAAAKALGPGNEVVVVQGDRAVLLPLLRKAGLEPDEVVTQK